MKSTIQTQREYSKSSIRWIGYCPQEWQIIQLKWKGGIKRGASPRPIEDPKYFDEDGEYAWVRISDVSSSKKYLSKTEQRLSALGASLSVKLEPNSLFLSIAGSVGKSCITKIKACIHDGFVYFPSFKGEPQWLFYIFESRSLFEGLGKMGTQLNLNTDTVGSIYLPFPSLHEQRQIAAYLNRETAKIDKLISKQQKLIKLLAEKRQAVISHAVTKGLDPNVKMKDSGVEWLGEVPEDWTPTKIKYVAKLNPSVSEDIKRDSERVGSFLPMEKVLEYGGCVLDMSKPASEVMAGYTYFEDGDVGYAKVTPCFENGKGTVFQELEGGFGFGTTEITVFRPEPDAISPEWLHWLFCSKYFRSVGESRMTGAGGLKRVPDQAASNLPVFLPTLEVQQVILGKLKVNLSMIDKLVDNSNESVELLKEHRQALITAAVTGKIDVRDLVTDEEVASLDAEHDNQEFAENLDDEADEVSYTEGDEEEAL